MLPEARTFQAGDRQLVIRLNMANFLTATRRNRVVLAEYGIFNLIGAGSEKLWASIQGDGPMPSIEADAIMATAALVENTPPIGPEEYLRLVEAHPDLAKEVEAEFGAFFQPRLEVIGAKLAEAVKALESAIEAQTPSTGGPNSEPLPSSTSESPSASSGAQLFAISNKSPGDTGSEPNSPTESNPAEIPKPKQKRGNAA